MKIESKAASQRDSGVDTSKLAEEALAKQWVAGKSDASTAINSEE
jgi:hypothetical protein